MNGRSAYRPLAVVIIFVALLFSTIQTASYTYPDVATTAREPTSIKEFIGVNGVFNNNPFELAQVAGWVRDYHRWYWYEATPDRYTWSTGKQRLDWFYTTLSSIGVKVMPDVELAPGWATSNGKVDGIPDPGAHARYMGALTSHYGSALAAVENYNEPNQRGPSARIPAAAFGAMTAGDYAAVKAANPDALFVLAGIAGADTTFLTQLAQTSGGKFDVINVHWYAAGDTETGGKNPESGGLFWTIDVMKAWRDAQAPGKPIWITEFGWDTFTQPDGRKSKVYAPETTAANYLLRAIFLMQGHGVAKGFVYVYRDPGSKQEDLHDLYSSSGLVTNNAEKDGRKKAGWYYLTTLKNVLGDYIFDRTVSNGPNIYRYDYALPGTTKRAAVLWAVSGERDNGYHTSYLGPAGTLVTPTDGSIGGTASTTDGGLILTERPVFILYADKPEAGSTPTPAE